MAFDPPEILARLRACPPQVTVVGDAILDRWLHGGVRRLSREAPVPVVEAGDTTECPGGGANTAMNLAALGAHVRILTVVGDDTEGATLLRILAEAGVDVSAVIVRAGGVTASKTRIVGDDQILVRVDRSESEPLPADERARFVESLDVIEADGTLVVCDYGAGLFDAAAVSALGGIERPRQVILDAHDLRSWRQLGPDVITPNSAEAAALLRWTSEPAARPEAVASAAAQLVEAAGAASAVVTLDREGTVVIDAGCAVGRTFARPVPEHQAAGAGDTFVAALAVARAVGAALTDAAEFAQRAAEIVVSRPGTAVCSAADLTSSLAAPGDLSVDQLDAQLREQRRRGRRIVFTNGCFDVLHPGHTVHLRQAKALGDVLVVALNDDDSVERLKGPGRPVNPVADRRAVLEALGCVDYVAVFAEDSPAQLLERLRPEIYAKGGDYTAEMLDEALVVRGYGGEVRILDYIPSHSTTAIVDRIAARAAR